MELSFPLKSHLNVSSIVIGPAVIIGLQFMLYGIYCTIFASAITILKAKPSTRSNKFHIMCLLTLFILVTICLVFETARLLHDASYYFSVISHDVRRSAQVKPPTGKTARALERFIPTVGNGIWMMKLENQSSNNTSSETGLMGSLRKQEIGPSFCATLVESHAQHGLDDNSSAWLAAMLYMAGYETTTSTLGWLVLAMIHFPESQRKAQEELDHVVGRTRIPTLDDMENLPYLRAVALRWRSPAPMGVFHASLEVSRRNPTLQPDCEDQTGPRDGKGLDLY
ncbi:cytochrome p450 [Moniliophthora roreri MCA 2997]|uniref:Cytochrome p450 n=1 Tax=Moniliophthora roreri (strain MCA 2997) TaxID=1381753 RepID=V2X2H6_MONRO|nr:cytochrome p450 [Moniliophthora roreri MCA 2997]